MCYTLFLLTTNVRRYHIGMKIISSSIGKDLHAMYSEYK